jgi:poly(A) polymerase
MEFTQVGIHIRVNMASVKKFKRIVKSVGSVAKSYGIKNSYVVGGYPRAIVMGTVKEDVNDLDFASAWPGEAVKLGSIAATELSGKNQEIYHRTGTVKFTVDDIDLEFQGSLGGLADMQDVRTQLDKYGIEITPLNLNIYSRDFTINTLIQDIISGDIYDITGFATRDIYNGVIRTPIDPDVSINYSPMIVLRAIRFSLRYNFSIERKLRSAMRKNSELLLRSFSSERLQLEILKMLKENYDGTMHLISQYDLEEILENKEYNIYNILNTINIDKYEGNLSELVEEKSNEMV